MSKSLRALILIAVLGASSACVVRGRAIYVVDVAPPAPQATLVLTARPGHVWIEGYWEYRGGNWHWRSGYWARDRAGYGWVPGVWEQRGNRWHWREGRWQRHDRPSPTRPTVIDHRSPRPAVPPPVVPPPAKPPGRR